MPLPSFVLALAGYRRAELDAHPFAILHRRVCLGTLALGSALTGAVLFGIAVSRIDPSHSLRFIAGAVAATLYFCMLLAFDSLFIVGARKPRARVISARIALSLMMTAFSSMTLDAVIAGRRLDAEIDARRLDANLAALSKQEDVHGLKGKTQQLAQAGDRVSALELSLTVDPDTPEFVAALNRSKTAELNLRATATNLEPQLADVRAQLAQMHSRLRTLDTGDERSRLLARIVGLRTQRDAMSERLRNAQRDAAAMDATVQQLREARRTDLQTRLQDARGTEDQARSQLTQSQRLTEEGAAASRSINEAAFEPNIVEQSASYWSLAQRDRSYLWIGLAVWLCCMTLELLAVLVKLQLTPDAADHERSRCDAEREAAQQAAADFDHRVGRTLCDQIREQQLRTEVARTELKALAQMHDHSTDQIVQAWMKLQREKNRVTDPGPHSVLERQFEALQAALTAKTQQLFAQMSVPSMMSAGGPIAGDDRLDQPAAVAL